MWLFGDISSSAMLALGMVMIIFILLRRSARYYRRRGKRDAMKSIHPDVSQLPRTDTPLIDAPPEILRWQVEMHETARDLKAELDSKMSALQSLIQMARYESDRLEAALAHEIDSVVSSNESAADGIDESRALHPSSDTVPTTTDDLTCLGGQFESRQQNLPGTAKLRSTVFAMTDLGHSPSAIASEVNTSVGDIEMILSCRGSDE